MQVTKETFFQDYVYIVTLYQRHLCVELLLHFNYFSIGCLKYFLVYLLYMSYMYNLLFRRVISHKYSVEYITDVIVFCLSIVHAW